MELGFEQDGPGEQRRLLVIESNRHYLGVIARRLGEFGYRTATAESAQSGLAELYRVPADLVLCSAKLPHTSGIELVRMLRNDPVHSALPLLVIVGRSDLAAAVAAFEAGADSVIRKPCHFEVLAACIARHLNRADSVRRLVQDKAVLDARVINRTIEAREARDQLRAAESERRRLAAIVEGRAA